MNARIACCVVLVGQVEVLAPMDTKAGAWFR